MFGLFILTITFFYLLYFAKINRVAFLLSKIPSPKKTLLFHNSLSLWKIRNDIVISKFIEWHDELGDVYHITLHPLDTGYFFISDYEIAKSLSLHQPDRQNSLGYDVLSKYIGKSGSFMSPPEQSKFLFKQLLEGIKPKYNRMNMKIFNTHAKDLARFIATKCDHPIEVQSLCDKLMLDVSFDVVLNYKLNSKNGKNLEYVKALQDFTRIVSEAICHPLSRIPLLFRFTSLHSEEKKNLKILNDFMHRVFSERKAKIEQTSEEEEEEEEEEECRPIINTGLLNLMKDTRRTFEENCLEANTLIFGMHSTTKTALTFCLYELAKNPSIQEKVFEEVSSLLVGDTDRDFSEKDLNEMVFTEAVIKESLRLYPPAAVASRKLESEFTTGIYTFPKGAEIFLFLYQISRNSKYFKDPLRFNPDRFLKTTATPQGYVPFSVGARTCLGMKMAYMIMKVLIARIINDFKISLVNEHHNLNLTLRISLQLTNGLELNFQRRGNE